MLDFGICSIQPKLSKIEFGGKYIKFGDSSYNRIKVIESLKIQHGGRPSCWTFTFATHSLNYRKGNSVENTSSLVILAATEQNLLAT